MILSKKIKVCILTSVHPPFDIRIFHKEAKSLVKAGYNVTLIAAHDKPEMVDGIKLVFLPKPKNRLQRIIKTTWQVYKAGCEINADIYHFHDPELIPIGLLLKHRKKRVIYDVHEDVPSQNLSKAYIPTPLRKFISLIISLIETFSARRFDGVITATPFIKERFSKIGVNAINVNNFPLSSELLIAESQWGKKERVVCYIGNIDKIRGAVEMVEAIGETEYKLLLAGNFEHSFEEKLKQLPGWKQVQVLGFLDRKSVVTIMASSMAGLVLFHPAPNHLNALPNKMFEYMSAGIPIIASDFPRWRQIIDNVGCGILVNPLDTKAIADGIRWIVKHPAEAKEMGLRGRRAVERSYNWEIEENKLINLYKEI